VSSAFSQLDEEVQVNILEIWAKVTDGNNRIVTDLKPEEFEIYIDGKKMPIRCFDETFATPTDLPFGEYEQNENVSSRRFIFFFDLLNTGDADIHFLKGKVSEFLNNSFVDGDEGMIFVLLPSTKLGVVQRMTSNKEALMDVVSRMRGNTMLEARHRTNEKQLLNVLYAFGQTGGAIPNQQTGTDARSVQTIQQAQSMAHSFAQYEKQLCDLTLHSFVSIADYLSGNDYHGRLVMIYASAGFSLYPGQNYYDVVEKAQEAITGVANAEDLIMRDFPDFDFSKEVKKTLGVLNRLNVTIYSVDAGGLPEKSLDVQKDTLEARLGFNNLSYEQTMKDSLVMVAQETGGLVYTGGQNFGKGLAEISTDMAQQYWLCSNMPRSQKHGSYHKVELKVLRPGLKVRHRKGYVD
jgi:VWFA-related protein